MQHRFASNILIVVVFLLLAVVMATPACALSVDIVTPKNDPYELMQYRRCDFEAVCHDSAGNDVTDAVTLTWDFADNTGIATGKHQVHRWTKPGTYKVTVTASTLSDSREDAVSCSDVTTVIITPLVATKSQPGPSDFTFYAAPANDPDNAFGSQVCDGTLLVCKANVSGWDPYPSYYFAYVHFERLNSDGTWVDVYNGSPQLINNYEQLRCFWNTPGDKNSPCTWRAHVEIDDWNIPPPFNTYDFYVSDEGGATWTPQNTVVKATGDELILHHSTDTSHTISWNITHLNYDNPVFTVTVKVYNLAGNEVATLTDSNAGIGAGSITWNTNLPATIGVYTYKITAYHPEDPPTDPAFCDDQDKSSQLQISNVAFDWPPIFTPKIQTLGYRINYTLNRNAAAGSVKLDIYNRLFQNIKSVTLSDDTSGQHSFVDTLTLNPSITGPYYFTISANETAADGVANRDGQPKPALQKGIEYSIYPRASHWKLDSFTYLPYPDLRLAEVADDTHYTAAVHNVAPWKEELLASWDQDGIFYYHNHACGDGGYMSLHGTIPKTKTTEGRIGETMYADNPPDLWNGIDLSELDPASYPHVCFVQLHGCCTAKTHPTHGNLCQQIRVLGVDSVLGFEAPVEGVDQFGAVWEYAFYQEMCGPEKKTISQAADAACDALFNAYGRYGNFDTYKIFGSDIRLSPARYGDL